MQELNQMLDRYLEILRKKENDLNGILNRKNIEQELSKKIKVESNLILEDPTSYSETFTKIDEILLFKNIEKSPIYAELLEISSLAHEKPKYDNNTLIESLSKQMQIDLKIVDGLTWGEIGVIIESEEIVVLSLPDLELEVFPSSALKFTQLRVLNLQNNKLKSLPSFNNFTELKTLGLTENKLSELPALNHTKLENLFSESNNINKLDGNLLPTTLNGLFLSNNRISKIKNLDNLSALKTLDLSTNKIKNIEIGTTLLPNLIDLNLSENPLEDYTINNEKIEWINLSDNKLIDLKQSLFNCINLKILVQSNSAIKEIPAEISKLINLEELVLFKNEIKNIDEGISKLVKLTALKFGWNKIDVLPESIIKLKNLEVLNLVNNNLSSLPSAFSKLENLKILYLIENNFNSIPLVLGELDKIKEIHFGENNITKLTAAENEMIIKLKEKGCNFYPDYPEELL